ncbi:MAG: hypothetical protein D6680_14605 [Cyanobacteria bacterium J007]|nr:MAG: hypothetical protein D6680_14605 [Cyanobacteria bacterium J007]
MKRIEPWMILLFLCSFLTVHWLPAGGDRVVAAIEQLDGPTTEIPAEYFGMHIHRAVRKPQTPWPAISFHTWRLWDAYVAWPDLEPEPGEWNFEILDRYVEMARDRDVEILLPLGLSPTWASARPQEGSGYRPSGGWAAEPRNLEDWRNYVRTVATHYKGKIHYYEIWNEPNEGGFYSGSVAQMVVLAREAYQILKAIDPTIQVVSPAATGGSTTESLRYGPDWLKEYLEQGGGDYADIIGYHFYVTPQPPEGMLPLIARVQEVMREHGVGDKPLWNTESGWAQPKTFSSPQEAVGYVGRSHILQWVAGVSRFYWYAWDNHAWIALGMVEADDRTLTEAAIAYREIQDWLIGARLPSCEVDVEQNWVCALTQKDGDRSWIVWNQETTKTFEIPPSWAVSHARDLEGNHYNLDSEVASYRLNREGQLTLDIGQSPLLLETGDRPDGNRSHQWRSSFRRMASRLRKFLQFSLSM